MSKATTLEVLLVEDDPEDAAIFRRYAEASGLYRIEVEHVKTSAEALCRLSGRRYDLVFLDQRLDEALTGLDLLKHIRPLGPEPPVIVLTGAGDEQTAVEMMKSGAADYLVKDDFNCNVLERSARHVLQERRLAVERERAEKALRESESRYRQLVQQIPAVVYTTPLDEASTTTFVSPQIKELIGFSRDEYKDDPDLWRKRLHPHDRDRVLAQVKRCHESGEPFVSEYRMIARGGRVVWVRDEARIVKDEAGQPLCLQGVMLDVSERRRLEQKVRDGERLRSIRDLAAGVAHNYNNLLSGIKGYATFIKKAIEKQGGSVDDVEKLLECTDRAAQLTVQLRASTVVRSCRFQPLEVGALVHELAEACKASVGPKVELTVNVSCPHCRVMGRRDDLHTALLNICENAWEAMPDGGTLSISADTTSCGQTGGRGTFSVIEISDTGVGLAPEIQQKIFDPFFSTKDTVGVGLSLSVTQRTIRDHDGTIELQSKPGEGSTFRILLPAVEEQDREPRS